MTTNRTIGNAVQKRDEKAAAIAQMNAQIAQYESDYAKVLPAHIDSSHWVRLAQGVLRRNDLLAEAAVNQPGSFLAALLECARLGHEPGTDAYALVPFRDKDRGLEVQGVEQYQGEIERMYRAGAVTAVVCEIVRANDDFRWIPGQRPIHEADWFADEQTRGDMVGVYAYAELRGGGISQVVVMGGSEIAKHRAVAKTTKIWDAWPVSMWKKTAVHELEKWVPTSAEYQREKLRAIAEADTIRQQAVYTNATQVDPPPNVDTKTGEITDGEVVE